MDTEEGKLGGRIASGAAWMVGARFAVRAIGFVSTIIVARLLDPEDFGLVALATSLYAFVEMLGTFNFGEAIIQRQDPTESHYHTAWTLNLLLGVLAGVLLAGAAHPAALFFGDPRLEPILYLLAVTAFIRRAQSMGVIHYRKELKMEKIFVLQLFQKVSSFVVTITIAFLFKTYWALVLGVFASVNARVLASYWIHPYRPRIALDKVKDLFSFSKWLFLTNLFNFGNRRSPDLVIGKMMSSSSLGVFNVAFEVSNLTSTELIAPLNHALFPGYSKISNDSEALRRYYLNTLGLVALVALPSAVGLSMLADPIVSVVLGPKWAAVAPVIEILALAGAIRAITMVDRSVYMAMNRPHLTTIFSGIMVLLLVPLLIGSVGYAGLMGASWSILLVNLVLAPLRLFVVSRVIGLPSRKIGNALWRPAVATVIMGAIVHAFQYPLYPLAVPLQLLLLVGCGLIVFLSSSWVLWYLAGRPESGEDFLFRQVQALLPRPSRAG